MFTAIALPYAKDALEPYIDAATMDVHYEKHYQTYITKLNAALEKYPDLANKSIEELLGDLNSIPEDIRKAVRNNGGGFYNHTLFWELLTANGSGQPVGELAAAIEQKFGNFTEFQTKFTEAATNLFGSGWVWLAYSEAEGLHLMSCPNQDNPVMEGHKPILGLDVWEHAYYLKYQNKRADYIAAWWNVINWDQANELYLAR
jgi:Fe-Mn family superoxide dismutase